MKRTNSWFWISILALLLLLMAPGQTVRAADEITLGYSGPLSGGAAKFGFNHRMPEIQHAVWAAAQEP